MRTRVSLIPSSQEAAMAVAVKNTVDDKPASASQRLAVASMVGGAYLLASAVLVFGGVPWAWSHYVSRSIESIFGTRTFVDAGGLFVAMAAVAVGLFVGFRTLAGAHPPAGFRAGVTVSLSFLICLFFLWVAVPSAVRALTGARDLWVVVTPWSGVILCAALMAGCLSLLRSPKWLTILEDQGWFSLASYKRTQGVRVRRLTLLGAIVIVGSGVWSLMGARPFDGMSWQVVVPFLTRTDAVTGLPAPVIVTVLPSLQWTVPLLLTVVGLWFSWRLVNTPAFADFLIATDAELNKVSWTSRKQLVRDTIVVLVTVVLLTVFLLLVDLVWGALFSQIGILPKAPKDGGTVNREVSW